MNNAQTLYSLDSVEFILLRVSEIALSFLLRNKKKKAASHICVGGYNIWYIGLVLVIGVDSLSA